MFDTFPALSPVVLVLVSFDIHSKSAFWWQWVFTNWYVITALGTYWIFTNFPILLWFT